MTESIERPNTSSQTPFIPGLALNRAFYAEVVGPLMEKHFPNLAYSAGLIGIGSDVIGFDDPTSMDHNWGPRLVMFFRKSEFEEWAPKVNSMLRKHLPYTYKGFSTNYTEEDPDSYLKQQPEFITQGEVNHYVVFYTVQSFMKHYLGFDRDNHISIPDWLTFPEPSLVEITHGEVFHDGLGELTELREKFAYYPRDIWLYAMRVQWGRIANQLVFSARSGDHGDEIGSCLIAADLVQEIMRMNFLMERQYAPYIKWFGTAYKRWLHSSETFGPLLQQILYSRDWRERQQLLATCYQKLGEAHNALGITEPIDTSIKDFEGRGYPMVDVAPFIKALEAVIQTPKLKNMKYPLGTIDQFINHTKISHENYVYRELRAIMK